MPRSRLLTTDDWPEAELRAAVLAGELVPVGPCWASPAEPQDPALRAAAAAWALPDVRLVAAHRTAAWVWGGLSRPPLPHECVVPSHVRLRVDPATVRVREVALPHEDVRALAGLRVTTPPRTAIDLLRAPGPTAGRMHPADEDAVQGLVGAGVVGTDELRRALGALGVVPMVRQAERRLTALFGSEPS
ncbi:type IV toxin-antitoxin system AbiEi family antitoxin [Curtobacterium sp. 458]|uniref:type IV toxin-antitoxin system AbiEi family antitoxin n=1 Tax=Curtobacterium sp. 458 TaxID=3050069 RepID=UPI0025B2D0DF|nr:type IV toxin-antitoxin system AbiEi family antitoxin [Curtobacterium sp. 458]WJX99368.1 type IV toxin-antitoxin system AbiEi family antitoxin [Curtobacterium sp. 458]